MNLRSAASIGTVCSAFLMLVPAVTTVVDARLTSQNEPKITCPPIVGIAHVALRTNHPDAARRFYGSILGFSDVSVPANAAAGRTTTIFKVNDHQYIEIFPGQADPRTDLLLHVAFETTSARKLRNYLMLKNATRVGKLRRTDEGSQGFTLQDPEGHPIEFVQYFPGSVNRGTFGKDMPETRISTQIIHAGFIVRSRAAEDRFFKNVLGFHLMWYGGMTNQTTDWVDMRVTDGTNWLEYMLNAREPSLRTLGVLYHFSLGVPSVAQAYKTVVERGYEPKKPQIGRDGKWQLNLYDPDGTRVELMEPKPVRTPCCSRMLLAGETRN